MALLKMYVEKNVKDTSVKLTQIPELFPKAGFKADTSVYKNIQKIISEKDINVETILDRQISDLIDLFNLTQNDDKQKFIRMRAILRKVVIEKVNQQLNISQIKIFNWKQVCQVFEEHVGMSTIEQSEKWYTYFEDNKINGSVLFAKIGKAGPETLVKNLNLNEGQKTALTKLFTEFQPKQPTQTLQNTMTATDAVVGVMTMGSGKVTTRNITVNRKE